MLEKIHDLAQLIERNNPRLRRVIGGGLILIGLLALITPFTPGSWLVLVGLELLGVRILMRDKLKK